MGVWKTASFNTEKFLITVSWLHQYSNASMLVKRVKIAFHTISLPVHYFIQLSIKYIILEIDKVEMPEDKGMTNSRWRAQNKFSRRRCMRHLALFYTLATNYFKMHRHLISFMVLDRQSIVPPCRKGKSIIYFAGWKIFDIKRLARMIDFSSFFHNIGFICHFSISAGDFSLLQQHTIGIVSRLDL